MSWSPSEDAELAERGFSSEQRASLAASFYFPPPGVTWKDITEGFAPSEPPAASQGQLPRPADSPDLTELLTSWMAASGASTLMIAEELSLPDQQVSLLLSKASVARKVRQIKEEYWGANMTKQFDQAAPEALRVAREMIAGDVPGLKASERWSAAQWILEKSTGKPKQEVALSGDHSLRQLFAELELLKQARETSSLEARMIDVTPQEKDEFDVWLEENVPND